MDRQMDGRTRPCHGHHQHVPLSKASQERCRSREAATRGTFPLQLQRGAGGGPCAPQLPWPGQDLEMARSTGPWVVGVMRGETRHLGGILVSETTHPGMRHPVGRKGPRPCSTVTSQRVQQQPRSKAQENKPHQNKVHSSSDPSTTTADSVPGAHFHSTVEPAVPSTR